MAAKKAKPRKATAKKSKKLAKKKAVTAGETRARATGKGFPVVGVGASAGGLEAFTQLLGALPLKTGLAFVLVQHLDPNHESMLRALLSHATPLPIHEAEDGMVLEANHVYVIPPNTNLAVLHGVLSLIPRTEDRGKHLPIDYFFRSLAADQKSRAIGVILSGTASDGTEGLRAIKAEGGVTFCQDEESARYNGMPHSAIAAGVVDFVLPPDGVARELARIGRRSRGLSKTPEAGTDPLPESGENLNKVFILLRSAKGVDFSFYKPTTLKRRIARRMMIHKIESIASYVRYLKKTPGEVEALYHDLLINVTSFFREPEVFDALKKKVFPKLLKDRPGRAPIRIWIPGCSTGEEVYSMAIVLLEYLSKKAPGLQVQIFATDISEPAIDRARAGVYPAGVAADISPTRLRRFFVRYNGGYQVNNAVRDVCVFARQDVTKDPPFSKLDLVSCRNLLIYLGPTLQKRVIPVFHYALKSDGYLLLGSSESIGTFADLFALADRRHQLYKRKATAHRMEFTLPHYGQAAEVAEPDDSGADMTGTGFDYQEEADRVVLNHYAPAGVVVNESLDILQFRGQTGLYLEPASGSASFNLLKMARDGLVVGLRSAIDEAKRHVRPARHTGAQVKSNGGFRGVDVEVVPLRPTPSARAKWFLVLFTEAAATASSHETGKRKKRNDRPTEALSEAREKLVAQLQHELISNKEYLQSVITEHERTNEELQSANEEILSSNEELQSTNEELETAKEELQSTNEELTTINDELHTRNDELGLANSDLVNLLNSVQIPIVILSGDLRIRRYTPPAERLLNLIPTDIGRPLSDLRPNIIVPEFGKLIAEVMDNLIPRELEVQGSDDRWFSLRIRPYKTLENKIDGVILALVDIDVQRRALASAREAQTLAEAIVETTGQPMLVLDGTLRIEKANSAFLRTFRLKRESIEKQFFYEIAKAQWDIKSLRKLLKEILPKNTHIDNFRMEAKFPRVGKMTLSISARQVVGEHNQLQWILLSVEEVKNE